MPAPTDEALQTVLLKIITRTMKLLTRKGVLVPVEEQGQTCMADNDSDSDEARVLRPLQAAACTYRIAFGPRAGQKVQTVQGAERGHGTVPADGPVPREEFALASASAACKACPGTLISSKRCAPTSMGSACTPPCAAAPTTARRWSSCAATSRAPLRTEERVQTNAAGQVVLKLKTAWRDGTTHLVMSPLEFMQRLAALVPRPRLHLIRFGVRITSLREVSGPPLREHGVLAPNAKLRAQVVPQQPEPPAPAKPPTDCEAACVHHRPVRLSWAKLLKRVFEFDLEHCPNCGGELKIVAAILEQPVIEKILTHLGLQARAPPRAPARGSQRQAA